MKIFILSSGRPARQITWASLPEAVQSYTQLVVPYDERAAYNGYPLLNDRTIIRDLAKARQRLIDTIDEPICMLDDDLVFATRRTDDPTKFSPATNGEITHLFALIAVKLDRFAHVGVSGREGANRRTDPLLYTTRMMRVLAVRTDVLRKENIRYDRMKFMIDFDVTLQLLRAGYDDVVINHMVQNQSGSNAAGGCSQYRTAESQAEDAHLLKQHHPDFVTLKTVQTKTSWQGMQERVDVTVAWKKAYASAH